MAERARSISRRPSATDTARTDRGGLLTSASRSGRPRAIGSAWKWMRCPGREARARVREGVVSPGSRCSGRSSSSISVWRTNSSSGSSAKRRIRKAASVSSFPFMRSVHPRQVSGSSSRPGVS
ncbi:MAG: hypothetical protein ACYTGU_20275, partial [Planctomycetota bacterium]